MDSNDEETTGLSGLAAPPVASQAPLATRLGGKTKLRVGDFILHVGSFPEAGAFGLPIESASHLLACAASGAATVLGSNDVDRLISAGEGFLFNGETIEQIFVLPGTLIYVLEISEDTIARRQVSGTGRSDSILLSGAIRGSRGRAVNNCLGLVVRMLEDIGRADAEPLANALLDTIVDMKLMAQRPRIEPATASGQIIPGTVRRAIRYIHQEAVNGVRPADVAEYAGMSVRSLQSGFAKFVGLSPASYITRTRLLGVKQGLEEGIFRSVADAARHWGFGSPSHFSQRYFEAFGEKPSNTKRGR